MKMTEVALNDLDSPLSEAFTVNKLPEETQSHYDQWAANYDLDVISHDYNGPKYTLQLLQQYVKKQDLIFCIGAGTGLEGQLFYDDGYTNMHAHDGSQKMLDIAAKRGIFKKLKQELLFVDKQSTFPTDYYNAIICLGCFLPGGLDERHVTDLLRTLQPGGIAIFGTREAFVTDPGAPYDYHFDLDGRIKKLKEEGKYELVSKQTKPRYVEGMNGVFYVIRKLNSSTEQ